MKRTRIALAAALAAPSLNAQPADSLPPALQKYVRASVVFPRAQAGAPEAVGVVRV